MRQHLHQFFVVFSLSADGRVVGISYKSNVYFYSGLSGALLSRIESVHTDHITALVKGNPLKDFTQIIVENIREGDA